MNPLDFLDELRFRLKNPAVSDPELIVYINQAFRDVNKSFYTPNDYRSLILDSACHELLIDGKFPEVSSISGGGVNTSFSAQDPERFRKRMSAIRQGYWI